MRRQVLSSLPLLAVFTSLLYVINYSDLHKCLPSNNNSTELSPKEIEIAKKYIEEGNDRQVIRNLEKFGSLNEETNVVVIPCKDNFEHMSQILGRLENLKGIENSLLIFSHKFFDPNITQLIATKFGRVLQIFYPFSAQLFPMDIPGRNPIDCGEYKSMDQTQDDGRVGKWTKSKHQFWWLLNFVFAKIPVLASYNSPINFLPADFYPTEDFFSVLKTLREKLVGNDCDGCNALSHGWRFSSPAPTDDAYSQAVITTWLPDQHLGISFNRTLWKKIKDCKHSYYNSNDCSAHWTLLHLSFHCLEKPIRVMLPKFPRVFHADCGTGPDIHKNCDPAIQYQISQKKIKRELFFPLAMSREVEKSSDYWISKCFNKDGTGWEDYRNRMICLHMETILQNDILYE